MNYLPLNKFVLVSPEFGAKGPFKNIRDEKLKDFEDYCYYNAADNPTVTFYGVSRIMKGDNIKLLFENKDSNEIVYSYYDSEVKERMYFHATSINSYENLKDNKDYRIEINITNDSFTIYGVDEE